MVDETNPDRDVDVRRVAITSADGFEMSAYVARPIAPSTTPGLVFITEAFGVTREMERIAREVARAGYTVIVPNLFERGSWFACIRRLIADLSRGGGRSSQDIEAARAWLATRENVDPQRLAVAGFCLGGGYALLLARTGLFRVAADFYGKPPASMTGACPVIAMYGARDAILMPTVPAFVRELDRANVEHEVHVFDGVGHSFMNRMPNRALDIVMAASPVHAVYDAPTAAEAMRRMLAFFERHV